MIITHCSAWTENIPDSDSTPPPLFWDDELWNLIAKLKAREGLATKEANYAYVLIKNPQLWKR